MSEGWGLYTEEMMYEQGFLQGADVRLTQKYGEPSPPSEFYDRLLSVGAIPPALVRESLFARKAEEVSVQGGARQD